MQRGRNHSSTFNVLVKIFLLFYFINFLLESRKVDGFSTELIHINSPLSPFFNPNLTDQGYVEQIGSLPLINYASFYLMKISYGTPPIELYHVIDTGTDLSWIQCLPCTHCFESVYAPFNPNSSSTFRFENCSTPNKRCEYKRDYEDNSHSRGDLARETITIGSNSHKKEFKDFLFGCGHDNVGHFPYKGAGMVGLNRAEESFITQLHTEHHGIFSYCMAPPESTHAGKISFGQDARVTGMTTPLIDNIDYTIMLTKITIGKKSIKYFPDFYLSSNGLEEKNLEIPMIVDSGSKATYLPNSLYTDVEQTIKNNITKTPCRGMGDYRLCYSSLLRNADIPKIKLHFPGVVLKLTPANTFIPVVRGRHRCRCLTILPTNETFVLGHLAQINYLVGFDLVKNKVSFKPTNCATL